MDGTLCANYLHLSQTMPTPDPLLASMPMFSPGDSKHLLTASGDQSVKLWDVVSGELLFSWNMPGCGDAVTHFSPAQLAVPACRVGLRLLSSAALQVHNTCRLSWVA